MAYNGPGAPLQRTTYTLGDNISSIVHGWQGISSLVNIGSGRVVGFVIKLDKPIVHQPDTKYVIFSSEEIPRSALSGIPVAQMSGGRYKKSRKTRKMRKSRGRKH